MCNYKYIEEDSRGEKQIFSCCLENYFHYWPVLLMKNMCCQLIKMDIVFFIVKI